MLFQREHVSALRQEVAPMLEQHWSEVAHYPDVPLDVDWALYAALDDADRFRAYSVRTRQGALAGYQAFMLLRAPTGHPHYRSTPMAQMDVLYLAPEHRGRMVGARFIDWCDRQLRAEGVIVVRHHLKARTGLNYGSLLERVGYVLEDLVYARRLDRGH